MKKMSLFLGIVFLFNLSYGNVITGMVVDSISNVPIADVTLSFRLGESPDLYPKAYTDSSGSFRAVVSIPQDAFPLQIIVEKTGYCFKKIEVLVRESEFLDIGRITLTKIVESTILFSGIVVDSVSGLSLAGVQISLVRLPEYKTFFTFTADSVGMFHHDVTISNSYTVVWGCKVEGYYTESGALVATMDSVLVKILCNPIGSIRIKVKGVVVDSLTRKPVGDAMIILQTTYHDVEKDSSYTDDNGIFSRSIMMGQTSSDIPSVLYQIVAEGYVEKWGNMRIPLESSASMDLDTLALLKTSIVSYASQRNSVQTVKSLNYRMFTLNGRMLFGKNGAMRSQGNGRPRASQTIYIVNESKKAVKIITFD